MLIIGCDYHPGFQQIACIETETGEYRERRLMHRAEAEQFYRELQSQGKRVCLGMEASGHGRWFERLLGELHFELRIGDAAEIRSPRVRKQKTDRQDAELLLKLLVEDRFPAIWIRSWENRDLRQLLWHRHRLVQMRTRVMNQLHVVALNEGVRRKKALWRPAGRAELESLVLAPWAGRRRQDLLELLDQLTSKIPRPHSGTGTAGTTAFHSPTAHDPSWGGGPNRTRFRTGDWDPERFRCGKQLASYVGLVPSEESSGDRRRLGHISKQGNSLLRFLLVEAAQAAVRCDPDWRRQFLHLALRRERRIAKVATARKLAVGLYWMWRRRWDYEQLKNFGSHAGQPGSRRGVQ